MKNWWKVVACLLILYSFVAGLLLPLKPGIYRIETDTFRTDGTHTVRVEGYNSQFSKAGKTLKAWLKVDDFYLQAIDIKAIQDNLAEVQFKVPKYLPLDQERILATLVMNSPEDGIMILPSAISVQATEAYNPIGGQLWSIDSIEDLHIGPQWTFPYRAILEETIRNLFYHVPLWFAMFFLFAVSAFYAIRYLRAANPVYDMKSHAITQTGIIYGMLGLITGAIWARFTWGQYWSFDVKQNMTAIFLMINLAYFVLRQSIEDTDRKARFAAVYNIFAFLSIIPLLYVIPRLTDSLHPGNGGNPGFGGEDLDNTMRMVFYPAIIGWILFGVWLSQIFYRYLRLQDSVEEAYE